MIDYIWQTWVTAQNNWRISRTSYESYVNGESGCNTFTYIRIR